MISSLTSLAKESTATNPGRAFDRAYGQTCALCRSRVAEKERQGSYQGHCLALHRRTNASPATEADIIKPKAPKAYWWYEAERAAASVPGLPLAITRSAEVVGPFVFHGSIPSRYALGKLYHWLGEPLKLLWGPELRINTIHVDEWCPVAWQLVQWVASRSRAEADLLAGEDLPPVRMKDKLQDSLREKVTTDCCRVRKRLELPYLTLLMIRISTKANCCV